MDRIPLLAKSRKTFPINTRYHVISRYLTVLDGKKILFHLTRFSDLILYNHFPELVEDLSGEMPYLEKEEVKTSSATKIIYTNPLDDWNGDESGLLKITYFDFPGKAESLRLACYAAGIPFIDERLTREEFIRRKESGELPFGQVPLLTIPGGGGGYVLTQSSAILRFIGNTSCSKDYLTLYAHQLHVAGKIDSIIALDDDCFTGLVVHNYKERFGFDFLNDQEKYAEELEVRG